MQIEKLQTCTRMFEVDACSGIHLFGNVNLSESPQKNGARDVWENSFGMKIGCLRFGKCIFSMNIVVARYYWYKYSNIRKTCTMSLDET